MTIPDSVVQEPTEDRISNQTSRTPLFPKSRHLDRLSPNLIWEKQAWEAVVEPPSTTNHQIILIANVVRRVISYVACPEHNLCAQWSIIVASETCLCLKSYLLLGSNDPNTIPDPTRIRCSCFRIVLYVSAWTSFLFGLRYILCFFGLHDSPVTSLMIS